jgi:hypothetical protein
MQDSWSLMPHVSNNAQLVTILLMKIVLFVKLIVINVSLEILAKHALMTITFTQDHVLTNVQNIILLKMGLAINAKNVVMSAQIAKLVTYVNLDLI